MALMSVCKSCSFGCHFLHALALSRTLLAVQFRFRRSRTFFKSFSFASACVSRVGMDSLSLSDRQLRSCNTAAT